MDTRTELTLAVVVVALGAAGTYLLLPHRHGMAKPRQVHALGGALVATALLLFALFWTPPGPVLTGFFFYLFSLAALGGGLMTIVSRNPIYSALWFASVVLSTSGLFLLAGAQFLAAGTVIVYAGAIIVTFLFVIMLAQMEGRATYDRAARSPFRATMTCFLLFWALLYTLFLIPAPNRDVLAMNPENADRRLTRTDDLPSLIPKGGKAVSASRPRVDEVVALTVRGTAKLYDERGRPRPHVAALGGALFTEHLVTVELAGALLFVALIGALAIATPKPPIRPAGSVLASSNGA